MDGGGSSLACWFRENICSFHLNFQKSVQTSTITVEADPPSSGATTMRARQLWDRNKTKDPLKNHKVQKFNEEEKSALVSGKRNG